MPPPYTLDEKIDALQALTTQTLTAASERLGIPAGTLSNWKRQSDELYRQHRQQQERTALYVLGKAQAQMAQTALAVVQQMTPQRLEEASVSQLSSALGTLIDRYLKLDDALPTTINPQAEKVIRIEYYDAATGETHDTPPWATTDSPDDSAAASAVRGSGVRQTVRQDADGADADTGTGTAR